MKFSLARIGNPITFAPTFTKNTQGMFKKFALLATMAAFFVACGSSTQENMENKADEAANSAQEMMDKAAAEAEAAAAEAAKAAEAAVDTAAAAAETAIDAAKDAAAH